MVENNIEKNSEYKFHNVRNQVVAVFAVNIVMLSHGCIVGWMSPALLFLQSENSPLETGPLTTEEISWVGSILCMGAFAGSLTTGYIAGRLGCKRAIIFLAIPGVLYWLSIMYSYLVEHLYLARFMAGCTGGGIQTVLPVFVGSIANNDIRGRLGTVNQLSRNVGVLLAYTSGSFLKYSTIPYVFIFMPIIFIIIFSILPNTPQYYLETGNTEEAKKALMFYKGCKGETLEEEKALHNELERLKLMTDQRKTTEKFKLKYLFEPECFKKLIPAIMLTLVNQMCGCFTIITYANFIFEQTGTTFDSNTSSIILAVLMICGTLVTTWLVDNVGRKKLLLTSMFGCCVGLSSMGTYLYLESIGLDVQAFNWVPMASLGTVVLVTAFGLLVLPGICIIEWLPSKIRTFGLTLCTVTTNIFAFSVIKLFPVLAESIHLYGCMFIFATSCALGIIYFGIIMEETKGKSLDSMKNDVEIVNETNKKNAS